MNRLLLLFSCLLSPGLWAANTVNVYVWGGEIPKQVIQTFEKETGIKVNFSTYDSNETMIAKIRASKRPIYDVILPSAYFVDRMKRQHLLTKLNHQKLPNLKNIETQFKNNAYDEHNQYSVPLTWGATGIFYNQKWVTIPPTSWQDLWAHRWKKKLMLLDDSRDAFAIGMLFLHRSPNDKNAHHIHHAFQALLALAPNIKLFASESIQAIMIDEDAIAGSAWNGDAYKAHLENSNIQFVYPKDGFVIWIDCLAIPVNPPHPDEAYAFINFLLEPRTAASIALIEGHAITNQKGKMRLPKSLRDNPLVYPPQDTLEHGVIQRDVGEDALQLYNQYWQELKLSF
jgi:spermidine/putrescine transport system substrate-binding protein